MTTITMRVWDEDNRCYCGEKSFVVSILSRFIFDEHWCLTPSHDEHVFKELDVTSITFISANECIVYCNMRQRKVVA